MLKRALFAAIAVVALASAARADGQDPTFGGPMPADVPVEATLELPSGGALEGGARALAFAADGKTLFAGTCGGRVLVATIGAGDAAIVWRELFHHAGGVAGVASLVAGGQTLVASAGDDGVVALSRAAQDKAPQAVTLDAGIGPLTALARIDDARLVAGSSSGALAIVRVERDGAALSIERAVPLAHDGPVSGLAALPGGRIASIGWDGRVRVTEAASGKEARSAKVTRLELTSIAVSAEGKTLVVGGWERGVRILDASTLRPACEPVEAHPGACTALVLAKAAGPHGARIARLISAGPADECVVVCDADAKTGKLAPALRDRFPAVPAALALSPDEARLAVGTWQGHVLLLRLAASSAGDDKDQRRDRHDAKPSGPG